MSDSIVRVGLDQPEVETRLARAIDMFTRWRADAASDALDDRDVPAIMVKTAWGPNGALSKTLIFEEPKWADFFLRLWNHDDQIEA